MKRQFRLVGATARDLVAKGVSPAAVAAQVGVHRGTIYRWKAAGKLTGPEPGPVVDVPRLPAAWGTVVRSLYLLDVVDEALVQLAEGALTMAQDPALELSTRLAATSRFQSLTKQLALGSRPLRADQA